VAVSNNEQNVDFPDLVIDTSATATAVRHVFRSNAVSESTGLQFTSARIDNSTTGGGSSTVYLKIYDSLDPVVGTTDPEIIIMAPHGGTTTVDISGGVSITNNVSYAVTQQAGTAGATPPGTTVSLHLLGGR
jgi:hypothetical protein